MEQKTTNIQLFKLIYLFVEIIVHLFYLFIYFIFQKDDPVA